MPLPGKCRMSVPCRWEEGGLGSFAGRARFRRHFGWPGRIDAHERVWLTFAGVADRARVVLNGLLLGDQEGREPFAFEVTSLLQVRNDLEVEVTGDAGGGIWGEVALEVRCTAFLRGLRLWATCKKDKAVLHAAGEVVGSADRPLELYLLLDHSTVCYGTCEARPEGQPFHLSSEELPAKRWQDPSIHSVQVDLINGASVWYTQEQMFTFAR